MDFLDKILFDNPIPWPQLKKICPPPPPSSSPQNIMKNNPNPYPPLCQGSFSLLLLNLKGGDYVLYIKHYIFLIRFTKDIHFILQSQTRKYIIDKEWKSENHKLTNSQCEIFLMFSIHKKRGRKFGNIEKDVKYIYLMYDLCHQPTNCVKFRFPYSVSYEAQASILIYRVAALLFILKLCFASNRK